MQNNERPLTKPEKLAKIVYEGIIRYTKARNTLIREKNSEESLDFLCNPSGNETIKIDLLENNNVFRKRK